MSASFQTGETLNEDWIQRSQAGGQPGGLTPSVTESPSTPHRRGLACPSFGPFWPLRTTLVEPSVGGKVPRVSRITSSRTVAPDLGDLLRVEGFGLTDISGEPGRYEVRIEQRTCIRLLTVVWVVGW